MTDLAPGIQVICIDDSPCMCGARCIEVIKGGIYTVKELVPSRIDPTFMTIQLHEVTCDPHINALGETHKVVGWNPKRFRPVRKTSIDIFTAILTKNTVPEHMT